MTKWEKMERVPTRDNFTTGRRSREQSVLFAAFYQRKRIHIEIHGRRWSMDCILRFGMAGDAVRPGSLHLSAYGVGTLAAPESPDLDAGDRVLAS